jgi:ATP-dependent Clp protease ATP-binding subunit ClpC
MQPMYIGPPEIAGALHTGVQVVRYAPADPSRFERYTEEARRVIFWARYEASAFGSAEISTVHLLLGLLRDGTQIVQHFLGAESSIEALQKDLAGTQPKSVAQVSTSVDLPLSIDAKRVLAYASEESERLENRYIDLVHLLLGLMRDPTTSAILGPTA